MAMADHMEHDGHPSVFFVLWSHRVSQYISGVHPRNSNRCLQNKSTWFWWMVFWVFEMFFFSWIFFGWCFWAFPPNFSDPKSEQNCTVKPSAAPKPRRWLSGHGPRLVQLDRWLRWRDAWLGWRKPGCSAFELGRLVVFATPGCYTIPWYIYIYIITYSLVHF